MNATEQYLTERDVQIKENMRNKELEVATHHFFEHIVKSNYVKNFTWMGVPILQLPSDLMVMQELLYKIQPGYIIETGIAFGGMTKFYLDMCEINELGCVISIDIDIRDHTKSSLKIEFPKNLMELLYLIEGSSIDPLIFSKVDNILGAEEAGPVFVSLDSNHTHDHVLAELRLYSPLVSVGSYIVVFDTTIDTYGHFDPERNKRPWGNGNNPASAVRAFLRENDSFVVDKEIETRALLTAAPGGWLKRIK